EAASDDPDGEQDPVTIRDRVHGVHRDVRSASQVGRAGEVGDVAVANRSTERQHSSLRREWRAPDPPTPNPAHWRGVPWVDRHVVRPDHEAVAARLEIRDHDIAARLIDRLAAADLDRTALGWVGLLGGYCRRERSLHQERTAHKPEVAPTDSHVQDLAVHFL